MTSTRKVNFAYNDDDVLTTRTLTTNTPVAESFVYDDNGLVSSHTVTHGEDVDAYSYTYDDDGNITEIKKGGATQQSYVYDANNQLIRENNIDTGKTTVYTYDGYGNILSKNEYAYTLGDLGAVVDTVNYSYDTAWKDKLVSYDGQNITYDEIGNPTNYMGAQMTWFARQMQSYTTDDLEISYKYDSDGLRTQKVINGVKHEYYYVDGKLQFEKKGDEYQIYYRYDSNGRPALAIKHDIAQAKNYYYYLITNTRGDVIETRNGDGNVNAKFTYDAWGKLISVTDGAGNALPETSFAYQISLKYRGYVYDVETGLYYLQSRYYDPETGRFLNADAVEYIGYSGEGLSYNLFAYCENDAVNGWDPLGLITIRFKKGYFNDDYGSDYYGGDDYTYNSKTSPSVKNVFMGALWKTAAKSVSRLYPDGYKFYMHYRSGNGMPLLYDYTEAIREDKNIRNYIYDVIIEFMKYVEKQKMQINKNYAYSSKLDKKTGVTPNTFNWKLAIGTHLIAISADAVKVSKNTFTTEIIILAFDRYNFSSSAKFAKIIPGSWNGELVSCGMAKNYTSIGLTACAFSWRGSAWKNLKSHILF